MAHYPTIIKGLFIFSFLIYLFRIRLKIYRGNIIFNKIQILNSEPNITVKDDYILVELKEADYWQMWDAIGQVHNSSESYNKNEIWVFSKGAVELADVALKKLKDFIKEFLLGI